MQRGQEEARRFDHRRISVLLLIVIGFTYLFLNCEPVNMSMNRVVKRTSCHSCTTEMPLAIRQDDPFETGLPITFAITNILLAAAGVALLLLRADGRLRIRTRWRHLEDLAWLWAKPIPFGSNQHLPYFRAERAH